MAASLPKIFLGQSNEIDSRLSDIGSQTQGMASHGYLPQLLNFKRDEDLVSHETDRGLNFVPQFLLPKLKISSRESGCSWTTSSGNTSRSSNSTSTSGYNSDSEKNIADHFKCHKKRHYGGKIALVAFTSAEEDFFVFMLEDQVEKFRRDNNREPRRQEMEQLLSCCY